MAKVTINGQEYDVDSLPEAARQQLQSVVLCDRRIRQLQGELAIAQTARNAYLQALSTALDLK